MLGNNPMENISKFIILRLTLYMYNILLDYIAIR